MEENKIITQALQKGWKQTTVPQSFPDLDDHDPENNTYVYVKQDCEYHEEEWIRALIIRCNMHDKVEVRMTCSSSHPPKLYLIVPSEVHEEFKNKYDFILLEKSKL